jgi:hypothetical protein
MKQVDAATCVKRAPVSDSNITAAYKAGALFSVSLEVGAVTDGTAASPAAAAGVQACAVPAARFAAGSSVVVGAAAAPHL